MAKSIQLRTPVPGPKSQALMRRREAAVARGVYHATPVFAAKAEGAVLEDVDGNRFLDFAGGIGCENAGHRARPVLDAVHAQLDRFMHTCFSVAPYEPYIALAERLNRLAPVPAPKKTFLANTGAEAVENAVKFARAFTKRPAIICFEDAFHGRTLKALALTSKTHPYKAGFEPFPSDTYRIPFAYCYRCAFGKTYPSCQLACAHHLDDVFKRTVAAESVAAMIIEPVLGEGGFIAPPADYLKTLHEICRKQGILLIADEVQTGIARTGTLFACEQMGVEPDLLVTAKSLGGGLPLASVTGRAEIMDAPGVGAVGGTFGGNPVACQAALAVLDLVEREDLCGRAIHLGDRFMTRARDWQARWPRIGAIHGLGAMRSLEMIRDATSRRPDAEAVKAIGKYCYEHGLLTISAGSSGNIVRLLMPLVITDEQFDEGLDVLAAALAASLPAQEPQRTTIHA
ncbi:MAG: 4-aminobutyrate--2-oxoglutarate transaminase [Acidobacteriales bacterium]|nr:4-aminobutyrate--2-oxoglutarate transaminase [Terriglobales bacterium]